MSLALLQQAFQARGFQVTKAEESPRRLHVTGRVPEDATTTDDWFFVVHQLLLAMDKKTAGWKVDVSKAYSVRKRDSRLVFHWRLIFQSTEGLAPFYPEIARTITGAPRSARTNTELMSFPKTGGGTTYNDRVGPLDKVRVLAQGRR